MFLKRDANGVKCQPGPGKNAVDFIARHWQAVARLHGNGAPGPGISTRCPCWGCCRGRFWLSLWLSGGRRALGCRGNGALHGLHISHHAVLLQHRAVLFRLDFLQFVADNDWLTS